MRKSIEKYSIVRELYQTKGGFTHLQEPDLLIYNDDCSEIIFAECKRVDTHDSLNAKQVNGLIILATLLQAKVYVCEIVEEGYDEEMKILNYQLPVR